MNFPNKLKLKLRTCMDNAEGFVQRQAQKSCR
uniref:Uncharacterized protein n=1 Tax=Setaria italica TaxID=4555 RepID=K3YFQ7_SETIT